MITSDDIKLLLNNSRYNSTKQIIANCPFCGKDNHFFISRINFLYKCHKCQESGNLFSLLKYLDRLDLLEGKQVDLKKGIKKLQLLEIEEELDLTIRDIKLPAGFKVINYNSNHAITLYLKNRKYIEEDFQTYQPGYTDLISKFQDYVIIPIYRNYSIKGYIARYIGKDDKNNPRYKNSKTTKFSSLLDGFDEITKKTETIIAVEGHFDRISVKNQLELNQDQSIKVVATFGKEFSLVQLELLRRTNVKNVYLFYDSRDAVNEVKKFGIRAAKYFKVFGCFTDLKSDSGDMEAQQIIDILTTVQPIQSFIFNRVQKGIIK